MTGKFEDEELYFAFKKFDRDNSGTISVAEIQQVLSEIGQNFSEQDIQNMIATVDANSDGNINFTGLFKIISFG